MPVAERFQGANVVDAGRLSPYWGEHAARYVYALPFVAGKSVLDIACGTGFGVGLMKATAASVTGVDVDLSAARDAIVECGDNAFVVLGDGLSLPFSDKTFDVVTSFETLEHLHERAGFLSELRRVLKPAGMMLLSTPNANYSQPVNGKPSNPFHIYEYTPRELRGEIEACFTIEQLLGQTLDPSTGITPFYEAQQRLPGDLATRLRLIGWKAFNKIPFTAREFLSGMIWDKPFYPTETDYNFDEDSVTTAPTLLVTCRKG